ncbi:hypothetical protein, partial [Methylobacterium trifolii]|uniref:hypothetical protein n=1 Tax=Methylobacterium trifolii TaxID=1003092 RepID=UPI001EDD73EC
MSTIYYINALAGAGKTFAMYRHAHALAADGEGVLIVLPTVKLIGEVAADLRSLSPVVAIDVIHTGVAESVVRSVLAALFQGPQKGRILIITWAAILRLPFFPNKAAWHVFIDEVPQVYSSVTAIVPETHKFLTGHVDMRPKGPRYGRIAVRSRAGLKKLAQTDDEVLAKTLGTMARDLLSPNLSGYADLSAYDALVSGRGKKLTLFFLLRPRMLYGFKRVTMLGANFLSSLLYLLWSDEGVHFIEDTSLGAQLRYHEHGNGNLVQIRYAVEGQWSKTLRDKEDRRLLRAIAASAATWMAGEPFAYIANKDVMDLGLFEEPQAHPLPQVSHGLNSFSQLHNVVHLSARLPPPEQYGFLAWRGADPKAIRRAVHEEAIYQTVLRISIRDLASRSVKKVVVPDRSSADYLQALLPGSTVQKLDGINEAAIQKPRGRKRQFDDSSSRSRAHRVRRNAETSRLAAVMMGMVDGFTANGEEVASSEKSSLHEETCNDNPLSKADWKIVAQKLRGSIFPDL